MEQSLCQGVKSLSLNGCTLGDQEMIALADAVSRNGNCLTSLAVAKNQISSQGASALFKHLLTPHSGLKSVDLSFNEIDDLCSGDFCRLVKSGNKHLQKIYLKHNGLVSCAE